TEARKNCCGLPSCHAERAMPAQAARLRHCWVLTGDVVTVNNSSTRSKVTPCARTVGPNTPRQDVRNARSNIRLASGMSPSMQVGSADQQGTDRGHSMPLHKVWSAPYTSRN